MLFCGCEEDCLHCVEEVYLHERGCEEECLQCVEEVYLHDRVKRSAFVVTERCAFTGCAEASGEDVSSLCV
jgi:hypothetical protein